MKRVEPQEGSGKTLTPTLLNSKASFFRQVCRYSTITTVANLQETKEDPPMIGRRRTFSWCLIRWFLMVGRGEALESAPLTV